MGDRLVIGSVPQYNPVIQLISKEQSQYIRQAKHTGSEKLRYIRLHGSINGIGKIAERWKFLINEPFDVSEKGNRSVSRYRHNGR